MGWQMKVSDDTKRLAGLRKRVNVPFSAETPQNGPFYPKWLHPGL